MMPPPPVRPAGRCRVWGVLVVEDVHETVAVASKQGNSGSVDMNAQQAPAADGVTPDGVELALGMTPSERADALEEHMMLQLNRRVAKSVLFTSGELDPTRPNEKVVLACLLHDIGVAGFIRSDHGYWGAQLVEPYVDEEVSWAIRAHQALRFYPDESVGYSYPETYIRLFGEDFKPEPYIEEEYRRARNHKWYMTSRLITVNDIYSFDPNAVVSLDDFVDIIGRNFKQPEEGLGFDNSPVAHMWRTMIWPTKYL